MKIICFCLQKLIKICILYLKCCTADVAATKLTTSRCSWREAVAVASSCSWRLATDSNPTDDSCCNFGHVTIAARPWDDIFSHGIFGHGTFGHGIFDHGTSAIGYSTMVYSAMVSGWPWDNVQEDSLPDYILTGLDINFLSNWKEKDCIDDFLFDFESNGIPFGS